MRLRRAGNKAPAKGPARRAFRVFVSCSNFPFYVPADIMSEGVFAVNIPVADRANRRRNGWKGPPPRVEVGQIFGAVIIAADVFENASNPRCLCVCVCHAGTHCAPPPPATSPHAPPPACSSSAYSPISLPYPPAPFAIIPCLPLFLPLTPSLPRPSPNPLPPARKSAAG